MSDFFQETIPCGDCANPFERTVWRLGARLSGLTRCPACLEALSLAADEQREVEAKAEREAAWSKICPLSYRDTNPADPRLDAGAKRLALGWDAARNSRGLGLIGSTGMGKTRCLFLALRRAHDAGRKVTAISHTKFSRVAMDAFSGNGDEKSRARDTLRNLHRADVLLLDDLGKPPSTERADSELEELVEDRTAHGKAILWTANGSGEWLIHKLGVDRGGPTVRRLAEFCEVVTL